MDPTEVLGRIAFFCFMGVMCSVGISVLLEYHERTWLTALPKKFWKRFVFGCWILIISFGISSIGWMIFAIGDWLTSHV